MFFQRAKNYVSDLYKKSIPVAENLFQKSKDALGATSRILGKGGEILGKIGNVGTQIISSNELKALADSNPKIGGVYNSAVRGVNFANAGSNLLNQTSGLTDTRNYSGNAGNVVNNALERAKYIKNDAEMVKYI